VADKGRNITRSDSILDLGVDKVRKEFNTVFEEARDDIV